MIFKSGDIYYKDGQQSFSVTNEVLSGIEHCYCFFNLCSIESNLKEFFKNKKLSFLHKLTSYLKKAEKLCHRLK